jgi:1,2-diacylglycerol 3-beta-galactosyltransferase
MDHHNLPEKPQILFLFSDTGGGHRSGAEAIIEAINLEYPGQISTQMVDIFKEYAPPPFNLAPTIYPTLSRMPDLWEFGYKISDGKKRTRFATSMLWPYIRRSLNRLVEEYPGTLIVSIHQLINGPVLHALRKHNVPFATVVTDMVSTHAAWFDPRADLIIVPTDAARQRALSIGVKNERIKVVGMPVADRFCRPMGDRAEIRARLGWPQDKPVILMVGGGEGMGPLRQMARAIDDASLPAALVVIAGRNQRLKNYMETHEWHGETIVYGFVREMPDFMAAADVLVTKAGPGTISEAFIAGLPLILYSRMPGQEDGNVAYVVKEGAGVWAPRPELVVETLRLWLNNPQERQRIAAVSKSLARPEATRQIARLLVEKARNYYDKCRS